MTIPFNNPDSASSRDPHESRCPDPTEKFGPHATCPCWACMDTGYLDADPDEVECDCGAAILQSEAEMRVQCERLAKLGGWRR